MMFKRVFSFFKFGKGLPYFPQDKIEAAIVPLIPTKPKLEANAIMSKIDPILSVGMEHLNYKVQLPDHVSLYDGMFKESVESPRVYIYNISPFIHQKEHSIFKNIVIPKCPIGKPYVLAFSIPEKMVSTKVDVCMDQTYFSGFDGKRVAMDIINPNNFGLDQNLDNMRYNNDGSDNLSKRGVFWSLSYPPKKEELAAAKKRLKEYYKNVLEKAEALAVLFPYMFQFYRDKGYNVNDANIMALKYLQIEPEHHAAADYMRVKTSWHPVLEPKTQEKTK
jgi:hypothetical protein